MAFTDHWLFCFYLYFMYRICQDSIQWGNKDMQIIFGHHWSSCCTTTYVKEVHIPRMMTSLSVIGAGFKNHRQHNTLQSYFSGVLDVRGGGWVLQRIVLETNIDWFGVGWGGGELVNEFHVMLHCNKSSWMNCSSQTLHQFTWKQFKIQIQTSKTMKFS